MGLGNMISPEIFPAMGALAHRIRKTLYMS
jgi:hypothetical protein